MKRIMLVLSVAAIVTVLLVTAVAPVLAQSVPPEKIPKTGGPEVSGSVVLPTVALLVGSGILGYVLLRRRS